MVAAKNNLNSICMLCGEKKRKDHEGLVGPQCYKRYLEASGKHLGRTGKDLPLLVWVLAEAKKLQQTQELQKELLQVQGDYQSLSKRVFTEAFEGIKKDLKGFIPKEKFDAALKERKNCIWAAKQGGRIYGYMKALEDRIKKLPNFIAILEEKIQSNLSENSENPETETNPPPPTT